MSEEVKELLTSQKLLQLDQQEFQNFSKDALHLAMLRGFLVLQSYQPYNATIINMSLEPIAKQKQWMETAYTMTKQVAEIMRNLLKEEEYVSKIMQEMSSDLFLKSLLELKQYSNQNQGDQRVVFHFARTDFMEDVSKNADLKISLVESNTIAASLCSHVTATAKTQRDLYHKYPYLFPDNLKQQNWLLQPSLTNKIMNLFSYALDKYCEVYQRDKENVIVLIIMSEKEWNSFDTYQMEEALWSDHAVHCKLEALGSSKLLFYKNKEVAMVYYRTGYVGAQYKNESDWDG